jgi:ectoine hydroxylase-related dioxygenase (phytanoyl-CoA dioxygenase family)
MPRKTSPAMASARSANRGPLPHEAVTDDYVMPDGSYDAGDMVMAPVRAGGAVFFHSLLPHYTAPNHSSTWRRAIVMAYMSARSRYTRDGEEPKYIEVQGETYPGCVR